MTAQEKVAGTDDGIWRFQGWCRLLCRAAGQLHHHQYDARPDPRILGLAQVARIHKEMQAVQKKMGVKGI